MDLEDVTFFRRAMRDAMNNYSINNPDVEQGETALIEPMEFFSSRIVKMPKRVTTAEKERFEQEQLLSYGVPAPTPRDLSADRISIFADSEEDLIWGRGLGYVGSDSSAVPPPQAQEEVAVPVAVAHSPAAASGGPGESEVTAVGSSSTSLWESDTRTWDTTSSSTLWESTSDTSSRTWDTSSSTFDTSSSTWDTSSSSTTNDSSYSD